MIAPRERCTSYKIHVKLRSRSTLFFIPKFMVTKSLDRNVSKCKKDLALNYTHQRKHSPKLVEPENEPRARRARNHPGTSSRKLRPDLRLHPASKRLSALYIVARSWLRVRPKILVENPMAVGKIGHQLCAQAVPGCIYASRPHGTRASR